MTKAEIDKVFNVLAAETGIPRDTLLKMRVSELKPLFEFVDLKLRLRIEASQAERQRLEAEEAAWLDAHPLWREHIAAKGA